MTVKESGQDKIEKICDLLKREALEPAQNESQKIIEEAKAQAATIIKNAEKMSETLVSESLNKISIEKKAADVALQEAHKQALESLKQDIEKKLFSPALHNLIVSQTNGTKEIADLITALVEAIKKEGVSSNFGAVVSTKVDVAALNKALGQEVLSALQEKGVQVGGIAGGVLLKLHDQKVTLDISDQALFELLNHHLRKDFRDKLFRKVS